MTLSFADLSVDLGGRRVLDRVGGCFAAGRVTIILGPNGAGKSTLLGYLAGLTKPTTGSVKLDGEPLGALAPRARARAIGLLPQRAEVAWDMVATALVALGRLPHTSTPAADASAVAHALEATDCLQFAQRRVLTLSGGELARVLLARVLAGQPRWLLADEPLASLDPAHQLDVVARLRDVAARGVGVVVVVHDLTLAARFADDVLMLREGRVVAAGPVATTLDAATIAEVYGVEVEMSETASGARTIVPIGRSAR